MIKTVFAMILLLLTATSTFAGSSLERGVLDELNLARTKPAAYAGLLRQHRKLYKGRSIFYPGRNVSISTEEGVSAVDEAIRFLDRQKRFYHWAFTPKPVVPAVCPVIPGNAAR